MHPTSFSGASWLVRGRYAFTLPGAVMVSFAALVWALLPPSPEDVGHGERDSDSHKAEADKKHGRHQPVGFQAALRIPGASQRCKSCES